MGGSNSSPQVTTQNTVVRLPEWVDEASQANYNQAQQVSENLAGPYEGQRVADMTSGQLANINALQGNVGSTQPIYNAALGITGNAANYTPTQVQGADIASNLPQFMNPYIQNVINPTLSVLDQQRQQALNQIGAQASRAGAFGGSRQGVQEGVTNAQYGLQGAQLAGQLYNQAVPVALGAAQQQAQLQQQANLANQAAGYQAANLGLAAGAQLGNLATQGQAANIAGIQAAMQGQAQLQAQQQAQLAAAQQLYAEQANLPLQKLQVLQSALSNSPYGNTTTGVTIAPGPSSNPLMQGFGLGFMGMSALGSMGFAPFSDRTAKTDIKKVGKDDETGLDIYSYRYKGDPKSYPKVVGPMAQDIQKKYPDQVREIGGKLAVNLGFGPMKKAFA